MARNNSKRERDDTGGGGDGGIGCKRERICKMCCERNGLKT